jgi:hypothetical protein
MLLGVAAQYVVHRVAAAVISGKRDGRPHAKAVRHPLVFHRPQKEIVDRVVDIEVTLGIEVTGVVRGQAHIPSTSAVASVRVVVAIGVDQGREVGARDFHLVGDVGHCLMQRRIDVF